jgi:mannose-6-phosphate isomerase-like protein (cupin superfamily)
MSPTFDDLGREHDVRPWGTYTVLDDAPGYKVKQITVNPGKRLSYQSHAKRAEHWFVVDGIATVTLDDEVFTVLPGASIDVGLGTKHRCANQGEAPLVFIEVQYGESFEEDDIVRYDDDFGRADR